MSDVAPRPWRVAIFEDEPDERYIVDANGKKFKHTDKVVEHVLKSVNEHDSLIARAEKAEAEATHHKNQAESNQQAYNDMHDAQLAMVKVNRELTKRAEKAEAEVEQLKFELNQIKTNYALIKFTEPRKERMKKCANGEDEDCLGCICNICIMTPDISR